MQQAVGEYIRQLRRQQSLTQTQLGADQFSKSYVSAVERDKITPSVEALHFFAEQLGQPREYFVQLQEAQEQGRQFSTLHVSQTHSPTLQEEFLTLFNSWLEGTEQTVVPLLQSLPTLSADLLATLSAEGQARYAFLRGLLALEQRDVSTALQAFEHALALAPSNYQPAILDHLGTCYCLSHLYQTALGYHQRALRLLQDAPEEASAPLRFQVELHCATDYRALGLYEQGGRHYERACQYLKASHELKTAGQLYLGLGYCTYAQASQQAAAPRSPTTPSLVEIERAFQRAISYLVQSRTVYQVSADRRAESTSRLVQALVLLDLVALRRHGQQHRTANAALPTGLNRLTLLQEAHDQCQQVLLAWQEASPTSELSAGPETILYTALAYLVRLSTQRVALARLEGYTDTATRERAMAAHLCQQALASLSDQGLLWTLVREVAQLPMSQLEYHSPSLPRLPDLSAQRVSPLAQLEVCWAAAELAEELGRAATTEHYAFDCYRQADLCFQTALTAAHALPLDEEHDPGSVLRSYQRCLQLLEERLEVFPQGREATSKTLAVLLKTGLAQVQPAVREKEWEVIS